MFDRPSFTHRACLTAVLCVLFSGSPAFAVQMKDDPKGFEGIPGEPRFPNRRPSERSRTQAG